ncbi:hypothetical protein DFJ77DRAFT_540674 [Powellomyces hirtus]|nr:hypothetical protein DFJ77DRAFT_540674 [Powellomyces hirtus]
MAEGAASTLDAALQNSPLREQLSGKVKFETKTAWPMQDEPLELRGKESLQPDSLQVVNGLFAQISSIVVAALCKFVKQFYGDMGSEPDIERAVKFRASESNTLALEIVFGKSADPLGQLSKRPDLNTKGGLLDTVAAGSNYSAKVLVDDVASAFGDLAIGTLASGLETGGNVDLGLFENVESAGSSAREVSGIEVGNEFVTRRNAQPGSVCREQLEEQLKRWRSP